jgi:hypothetical protein
MSAAGGESPLSGSMLDSGSMKSILHPYGLRLYYSTGSQQRTDAVSKKLRSLLSPPHAPPCTLSHTPAPPLSRVQKPKSKADTTASQPAASQPARRRFPLTTGSRPIACGLWLPRGSGALRTSRPPAPRFLLDTTSHGGGTQRAPRRGFASQEAGGPALQGDVPERALRSRSGRHRRQEVH